MSTYVCLAFWTLSSSALYVVWGSAHIMLNYHCPVAPLEISWVPRVFPLYSFFRYSRTFVCSLHRCCQLTVTHEHLDTGSRLFGFWSNWIGYKSWGKFRHPNNPESSALRYNWFPLFLSTRSPMISLMFELFPCTLFWAQRDREILKDLLFFILS